MPGEITLASVVPLIMKSLSALFTITLLVWTQSLALSVQTTRTAKEDAQAYCLRGQASLEASRYEEALKELGRAVALDPSSIEAWYQLGLAQWNLGRFADASATFQRTLGRAPGHALSLYYLARIDLQSGNTAQATTRLEQVIRLGAGAAVQDEHFQLAKVLLASGRFKESVPVVEAGIKLHPRDHRLFAQMGRACLAVGRKEDAEKALSQSNELREYQREATRLLLEASEHLKAGALDQARAIYQRLIVSNDVDDLVSLGIRFLENKLYPEATHLLMRAAQLDLKSFEARYNLGLMCLRTGRPDEAREYLASAAALRPFSFEVHSLLGVLCSQSGKIEEAIRALQQAAILRPRDLKVATLLALQLLEGRFYAEALNRLERSVSQWPDSLDLRLLLIQTCHRDQKYEKAVQAAQETLKRFPDSARANFEMGYQLSSFGKFQQSRPFFERAIQLDPAVPDAYAALGDVLVKEGRYEDAVRYLRLAIAKDRAHLDAYLGLAKSLLALRRYTEAIQAMEQAVQIDPANPQPHFHLSQAFLGLGEKERAQNAADTFKQLNQQRMLKRDAEGGREFPPK